MAGAARAEIAPVEDHLGDPLGLPVRLPRADGRRRAGVSPSPANAAQREVREEAPGLGFESGRPGGGFDGGCEPLDHASALHCEPEDAGAPPAREGAGRPRPGDDGTGGSSGFGEEWHQPLERVRLRVSEEPQGRVRRGGISPGDIGMKGLPLADLPADRRPQEGWARERDE